MFILGLAIVLVTVTLVVLWREWYSFTRNRISRMPSTLNCYWIDHIEPGLSWRGLAIGVTPQWEVLRVFDFPPAFDPDTNSWIFPSNAAISQGSDQHPYARASACFIHGKLAALSISEDGQSSDISYPQTVADWIEEYGYPDRVTWAWGDHYPDGTGKTHIWSRTLIWAASGLMVEAELCPDPECIAFIFDWVESKGIAESILDAPSISFILFAPLSSDTLESSLIFASLPKEPPPDNADFGEYAGIRDRLLVEDPWRIERWRFQQ